MGTCFARKWLKASAFATAFGSLCLPIHGSAEPTDRLQLAYLSSFGNGSLDGSVDKLQLGALQKGDSNVVRSEPTWEPAPGAYTLAITRPVSYSGGPVSAGLFATPVNFAGGSIFAMRGTFIRPTGPHQPGTQFAVTLSARTGGVTDLFAETRLAVTFQVRANSARLNVLGGTVPPNLPNMPQNVYDAIFDPVDPQPFTLEVLVDRANDTGVAKLKVGDTVISHQFQLGLFKSSSPLSVTAVGPTVAVSSGAGQRATVQVRSFAISTLRPQYSNPAAANCPPSWAAFHCRAFGN